MGSEREMLWDMYLTVSFALRTCLFLSMSLAVFRRLGTHSDKITRASLM